MPCERVQTMMISLIAAASKNHVIGQDGDLPWRLPDDMAFFRKSTLGHPVIMGRRTWDTLRKPLDQRLNIVLSRQPDLDPEGAVVVRTPEQAIEACGDAEHCFIIGGGEIYRLFLPLSNRILLTRIHTVIDGDAEFPLIEESQWELVSSVEHPSDDRHAYAMTFECWRRR